MGCRGGAWLYNPCFEHPEKVQAMPKKLRKIILLVAKIFLSAGLLIWVLSQVHWHDFVVAADGAEMEVASVERVSPGEVRLIRPGDKPATVVTVATLTTAAGETATSATPTDQLIWQGFVSTLGRLNRLVLVAAVGLMLLTVVAIGYRWWRLLKVQQIEISLGEAIRLSYLGMFYNQVIPGTVGGDVVKAYYLSKHNYRKTTCLITVLVDRVLGLTGLTLLSAIMLAAMFGLWALGAIAMPYLRELTIAAALSGSILAGLVGGAVMLFSQRIRRWIRADKWIERLPMAGKLMHANEVLSRYRRSSRALVEAMGHTLIAQLIFVASLGLLGKSMGLAVPWYQYLVFVPIIYIIGALPISLGGVGVIEWAFVAFFSPWTQSTSEIMALALLARLNHVVAGLPGVAVLAAGPKLPSAEELRHEMDVDGADDVPGDKS